MLLCTFCAVIYLSKVIIILFVISLLYDLFDDNLFMADCSRPIGQLESANWSTVVG